MNKITIHGCKCKSGKKYKDCCMIKQQLINAITGGLQNYDEKYVLGELLEESEAFNDFYKKERANIKTPLFWIKDEKLSAKMRSSGYIINQKQYDIIYTKKVPINMERVIDTAHEIQHIICNEKGLPAIQLNEKFQDNELFVWIAATFVNLLADPIVNSNLLNYDFNIYNFIKKETLEQIPLMLPLKQNINELGRLNTISFYIQNHLEWELLNIEEVNLFSEAYRAKYDFLLEDVDDILNYIKTKGYDTNEKVRDIYLYIISKYNLHHIFSVV